jgi:Protein of unknown function (DUF3306)
MSDEDQSGDNKSFLARWSQRKRDAKQPDRDAPAAEAGVPSGPVAESDAVPEYDLSSLPKLEDLTATTDITAFLRKGVPEYLRNAALRKSWALDPAIRNYVNPALEYAYDWNTPGGVPGSSEIGAGTDVARLVSQIMGSGEPAAEPSPSAVNPGNEPATNPVQSQQHDATQESQLDLPTQALRVTGEGISRAQKASDIEEGTRMDAEQAEDSGDSNSAAPQQAARRHGSAKPLV